LYWSTRSTRRACSATPSRLCDDRSAQVPQKPTGKKGRSYVRTSAAYLFDGTTAPHGEIVPHQVVRHQYRCTIGVRITRLMQVTLATLRQRWKGHAVCSRASNDFWPIVCNHGGTISAPIVIRVKLQRVIPGNDLVRIIRSYYGTWLPRVGQNVVRL